jgi:hypothetical protein
MTPAEQPALEVEPRLKTYLADRSVSKVLFIDDGFDPLEQMEPTEDERDQLWTSIADNPKALADAEALGIGNPESLNGEVIAELRKRSEEDPLRRLADGSNYVAEHANKTRPILSAIEYLKSLGVTVATCGENDWERHVEDVSIVFLDWRLGHESDENTAIERAKTVARRIHKDRGSSGPMIVLISSSPSVKDHARAFSHESGLISGLFDAMPKAWLKDSAGVDLQMTVLGEHLQKGHVVQKFVDALNSRTKDAADTFVQKIQNLTLSDFANLQHFALRDDGHPLGDYLAELLAGVWVDALFRGPLRAHLKALDREDFESPPALLEPSEAVNELYNAAMFDTHVGDFERHPQEDMSEAGEPTRLALSLGDIVVEQEGETASKIYVVVNPQCDLAESPRSGRRIDDDLSVLLVPGELLPVDGPERKQRKQVADTPYFAVDGVESRIQWNVKKQIAVPYCELPKWLAAKPRKRRARMRSTFALALQMGVRSELGRVGLPVPPPVYKPIEVKIRYARTGQWTGDATPRELGRLLMARDSNSDLVVLTHEFLTELCGIVQKGIEPLAAAGEKGDSESAETIRKALADPAKLRSLARPFQVPSKSEKFLGGAVVVCRESKAPSAGLDRRLMVCLMLPDTEAAS